MLHIWTFPAKSWKSCYPRYMICLVSFGTLLPVLKCCFSMSVVRGKCCVIFYASSDIVTWIAITVEYAIKHWTFCRFCAFCFHYFYCCHASYHRIKNKIFIVKKCITIRNAPSNAVTNFCILMQRKRLKISPVVSSNCASTALSM